MPVLVEVCVDSIQSLHAAIRGGADRIELCSALALGGLTPSDGFMRAAAATGTPTFAMIRPHAGGFDYSPDDIAVMEEDIHRAADLGLAGVVFGATADEALDVSAMKRLASAAGNMGKTLHRAFDLLEDPIDAVDKAIDIGVDRILTSGGATTAEAGADMLASIVQRAGNRISVMAGSGIREDNVARIVGRTGVREIHGSFAPKKPERPHGTDRFGFSFQASAPDIDTIRRIKHIVADL